MKSVGDGIRLGSGRSVRSETRMIPVIDRIDETPDDAHETVLVVGPAPCARCVQIARIYATEKTLLGNFSEFVKESRSLQNQMRDLQLAVRTAERDTRRLLQELRDAGTQHQVCAACGDPAGPGHATVRLVPEVHGDALVCPDCQKHLAVIGSSAASVKLKSL